MKLVMPTRCPEYTCWLGRENVKRRRPSGLLELGWNQRTVRSKLAGPTYLEHVALGPKPRRPTLEKKSRTKGLRTTRKMRTKLPEIPHLRGPRNDRGRAEHRRTYGLDRPRTFRLPAAPLGGERVRHLGGGDYTVGPPVLWANVR